MGEMIDTTKGKGKQIEGILTGDKVRQGEGLLDEAKGNIKGLIDKAEHAVHDAVAAVKGAVKDAAKKL
jgi:uncharacterized protein YjbJ (UPF0337 family)